MESKKPDWFDLDKYAGQQELNGQDWATQLEARARFYWEAPDIYVRQDNAKIFKAIKENPLYPFLYLYSTERAKRRKEVEFPNLFLKSLEPLTMHRALDLSHDIPQRYKDARGAYRSTSGLVRKSNSDLDEIFDNFDFDPLRKYENYPADFGLIEKGEDAFGISTINLTIDLNSPDKLIIQDLKNFLTEIRKMEQIRGEQVTGSILSRLESLMVLPYLDLDIYSRIESVNLSNHILGDWLFPDELKVDVTEKVRKSTEPLAKKAVGYYFITAINNMT